MYTLLLEIKSDLSLIETVNSQYLHIIHTMETHKLSKTLIFLSIIFFTNKRSFDVKTTISTCLFLEK